jgi:hypothetical protein
MDAEKETGPEDRPAPSAQDRSEDAARKDHREEAPEPDHQFRDWALI